MSLYDAIAKFISEKPSLASKHHCNLLFSIFSIIEDEHKEKFIAQSFDKEKSLKRAQSLSSKYDRNFVDFILQHLIYLLSKKSNRNPEVELKIVSTVAGAIRLGKYPTPSFLSTSWESLVKTSLKSLFTDPAVLSLLADLVPIVYFQTSIKEVKKRDNKWPELDVQAMFQLCISHTAFLSTLLKDATISPSKVELTRLLHSLFSIDSGCMEEKLGHIFMNAYSASMSETDQRLLHMMREFIRSVETKEAIPILWGNAALEYRSTMKSLGPSLDKEVSLKAFLEQIDPKRMSETLLQFPQRRSCEDVSVHEASYFVSSPECYDPNYLLPVFIQILSPDKIVPMHLFVIKGCLGFLFICLTSHHARNRLLAYRALNEFYSHLDSSHCSEKLELAYILDLLNASRNKDNQKLPFVVALFLARAVKVIAYPSDHMYLTVLNFLTAKPEIDLSNVPEFYRLFFSAGGQFRKEQNWILRLLRDGIRDSSDYWLYQKKGIFQIIMAYYTSSMGDEMSQGLILETVKNACQRKAIAVNLVREHGLLSWLATSVSALSKRTQLVNAFCSLVHDIWFSLFSKVLFEDSVDCRNTTVLSKEKTLFESTKKNLKNTNNQKGANLNEHLDDHEDTDDNNVELERLMGNESSFIDISMKKLSSNAYDVAQNSKRPLTIPKSTIVDIGLVIKSLIWHLDSASPSSVLQVLKVVQSLNKAADVLYHKSPSQDSDKETKIENMDSQMAMLAQETSRDALMTSALQYGRQRHNPHLFKLSSVELYVIIYFTAKNVGDKLSMTRASYALQELGVSMDIVLGARSSLAGVRNGKLVSAKISQEDDGDDNDFDASVLDEEDNSQGGRSLLNGDEKGDFESSETIIDNDDDEGRIEIEKKANDQNRADLRESLITMLL